MTADVDLIAGIRAGEAAAFEALYEKYKTQIFRTALAITGDRRTAEEVLQDTFVQAFAHADTVDSSLPLAPWLHRIAINLSANRRARKRLLLVSLDSFAEHIITADEQSPEGLAERNELRRAVQRAIAGLDFKHRSVIVLYYLQDFSLREIAYILDCPVGTVKSRLYYASRTLKQRLAPERRGAVEVVRGVPAVS
jgi:RNA polymerase sigma-70 factor (ECF subfamily)